ncbi:MAG: hypothetical protein II225_01025, partial [Ruminococcus sp.]|nr:hypothetical protein [Ruminococcus sp.]
GNPRKFASCKVMFLLSNNSKQEPLNGEAGYDASGTIYVKNKIVTFNSKIITSHIDANTGEKLADDVVKEYNNVTSNEIYLTNPIKSLGSYIAPTNASANLKAGSTCVVYMYDGGEIDPPTPGDGALLGDVDSNNKVNVRDATAVQKHLAGMEVATFNEDVADADESGKINVKDATAIQKFVAGMLTDTNIGKPTGNGGGDAKAELTDLYTDASAFLKDKADFIEEYALGTDSDELKEKASKYGFNLADEDTSKNEYQKFNTVLTSVSFYVVNGGTNEEIDAALESLKQAYDWFKYYTTELRKDGPVTADPSDPYSIDVSNGEYPIVDGYYTVVFSTKWKSATIYSWGGTAGETATWPGVPMKWALTNDYGEEQYVGYVPVGCTNYIINGDGGQTIDLEITGSLGMYMADMTGGKYNVGYWDPNFYTLK